jgi:hypothetical protein
MLAGGVLVVGLLFTPAVQGWLVKRFVATQPGWRVDFKKFGLGFGGLEAHGVDFNMPGVSAQSAPLAIRIAPLRLFRDRELRIERVEAQQLNVILTPAELVATPAAPAPPFTGFLPLLQSPLSWAIDDTRIDGQITVNDAGQSVALGEFTLRGGGLSAQRPGEFTYTLAVNSALLPLAPDHRIRSTGTLHITQTSANGVARVTLEGDLTLPAYGPLRLPPGKFTLTLTATATGEDYHATLAFGSAGELEFHGQLQPAQSVLTGRATFRADQSLAASLAPDGLPAATTAGSMDFALDLTTGNVDTTVRGDFTGSDWGKLMPELAVVDALKGRFTAALARHGAELRLNAFDLTFGSATGPATGRLALTRPVNLLQLPDQPLAALELARWPAAWANPWLVENDLRLDGGEFAARWDLRLTDAQTLRLEPTTPAILGPTNVTYDPLPPLRAATFTLSPVLTLTEQHVTIAIADLAATTPHRDELTASLTANYELATENIATTGQARIALPDWLALPDQPPPFVFDTRWDVRLEGDLLHLQAFALTARRDATTPPGLTVELMRPLSADLERYTATADAGTADWLRVSFAALPLEWVSRWLPDHRFTGALADGTAVLRPGAEQAIDFVTTRPWHFTGLSLTAGDRELIRGEVRLSPKLSLKGETYAGALEALQLSDAAGNQLTGLITGQADLATAQYRARLELAADLPALPHSTGTFGALTGTLRAELHNPSATIAIVEGFDLRLQKDGRDLLTLAAPEPFLFGLSDTHMFSFSTLTPLRLSTGEIPLAWLRPFSGAAELTGTLQPADFMLGADLTKFQLRPLKPVQVRNFAARLGPTELVRETEFSFYPGADLTFILVTLPKFQLAYNGTVHVTDGTLVVNGQPAATIDLALGYLGNDELILPNSLELSARVDFAPLARLAALEGRGLPPRGTLVTRLNGSMLGSAPLESWTRIEGVPAADGKRTLPPLEITAHGQVQHKTKRFDADVSVLLATTPQPTDMHFDVSLNLRDANLHFASTFRSRFIDAAELLAYATAFQPAGAEASAPALPGAPPPAVTSTEKRLSPQLGTPFWSALRGHFDLDIGAVQFAPYRIDGVKGRLDLNERELVLSQLSGEMFAGRWGGTLRVDYDPAVTTGDHRLHCDFHIEQFESARVVQTVFPNQIASVDARINVTSTLTSQGNLLLELIDRTEGSFTVSGKQGVMRLTVPKQDMMATAVVFGGTVLLSPELRAMGRLLRQFSEMPLDQLHITGRRSADGTVSLDEFRFDSPQARLLGRGRIPSVAGEPLMNRPLELSLDLAAKDEVAVILGGMNLIEKKPRADGYRAMKETFVLGGKAGEPDTRPLYDLLAKAVSGSKGTWGFLMRKVQSKVDKAAKPVAPKKTAATLPPPVAASASEPTPPGSLALAVTPGALHE